MGSPTLFKYLYIFKFVIFFYRYRAVQFGTKVKTVLMALIEWN